MTAVARVNPQRVMIRMHPTPAVLECLSSIGRNVKLDAHHVNVVRVARVHPNLAVIKRSRIETVHALPTLAAILAAVNAPTLKTILPLLLLRIGALSTKVGGVWQPCAAAAPAKRQLQLLLLLTALHLHLHLVVRLVRANGDNQVIVAFNLFVVQLHHNIARLDARLFRGPLLRHVLNHGLFHLVPPTDTHKRDRRAHTVLVRLDDTVDDIRILLEPRHSNPPHRPRRQPLRQFFERLSAIGCLVEAASRAPALSRVAPVKPITLPLVHRHQQRVRLRRMHLHLHTTRLVINVQNLLPSLPAIDTLE